MYNEYGHGEIKFLSYRVIELVVVILLKIFVCLFLTVLEVSFSKINEYIYVCINIGIFHTIIN